MRDFFFEGMFCCAMEYVNQIYVMMLVVLVVGVIAFLMYEIRLKFKFW